ncbi:hypothetical protein EYF80_013827 [Liparis tanakae]|uniref:Uncharacterized protein n=1 Tax=Liparis tanakae TaxID=230148 RepID=A0A4Z2ID77_9TELE|nr:hypothetical protein EYF80_013827 [Liparis tanakae]
MVLAPRQMYMPPSSSLALVISSLLSRGTDSAALVLKFRVALISPARLDTWQVYFPLCLGIRFFRLRVHLFFFPSPPAPSAPASSSSSGRLSFSHTMSGRGFPLAVHFSRTELPTGRAMTRFLIFDGCVKRGRTARGERESELQLRGEFGVPVGHPRSAS